MHLNRLNESLARLFPAYETVLTSRGATAVYLAASAIKESHGIGEIIIPSTVCPSVPLAILYSGMKPVFCDVELDTFCLSSKTIKDSLSPNTRAVLVVHLFGKIVDINEIKAELKNTNCLIIEDLAQAIGGKYKTKIAGNSGDFTVLSFNSGKLLKGDFGALLIKNRIYLEYISNLNQQITTTLEKHYLDELATSFRNLTHGLYDLLRTENLNTTTNFFNNHYSRYKDLFIQAPVLNESQVEQALISLEQLAPNMEKRKKNYIQLCETLSGQINYVRFTQNENCWRFPLLLDNHKEQFLAIKYIRRQNILISNHYFPTSCLFGIPAQKNAKEIGLRAINLWVDEKTSSSKIKSTGLALNGKLYL